MTASKSEQLLHSKKSRSRRLAYMALPNGREAGKV
jgi:hypothetical protein